MEIIKTYYSLLSCEYAELSKKKVSSSGNVLSKRSISSEKQIFRSLYSLPHPYVE